jgi:ribosomal protein L16 Arg81 hydroxylase
VIINAYASPAGKGFGMHFDSQSVFIIQLDGSKKWRYALKPALPNPPSNCLADESSVAEFQRAYPWAELATDEASMTEQTLQPGDVLYLPAGTWHRAEADGHSIALTLTILPFSARDLLLEILAKALEREPNWRQYMPLIPVDCAPVVGLPASIEEFIAAKIRDLRMWTANLTVAKAGVRWRSRLADEAAESDRVRNANAPFHVTRQEVLRVNHPVNLLSNPQDKSVAFFAGSAAIEMSADNGPFLEHLIRHREFIAQDATAFCAADEELDWANVRDTLQLLVQCGSISISTSDKKIVHKRHGSARRTGARTGRSRTRRRTRRRIRAT